MVADFGVALIQDIMSKSAATLSGNSKNGNGTLRWMAPERFEGQPVQKSSDIYSFAVTAWELYSGGEIPFSAFSDSVVVSRVLDCESRPSRPVLLQSDDLWRIITACWLQDPKGRPTFVDVHMMLKRASVEGMYFCLPPIFVIPIQAIACLSAAHGDLLPVTSVMHVSPPSLSLQKATAMATTSSVYCTQEDPPYIFYSRGAIGEVSHSSPPNVSSEVCNFILLGICIDPNPPVTVRVALLHSLLTMAWRSPVPGYISPTSTAQS